MSCGKFYPRSVSVRFAVSLDWAAVTVTLPRTLSLNVSVPAALAVLVSLATVRCLRLAVTVTLPAAGTVTVTLPERVTTSLSFLAAGPGVVGAGEAPRPVWKADAGGTSAGPQSGCLAPGKTSAPAPPGWQLSGIAATNTPSAVL